MVSMEEEATGCVETRAGAQLYDDRENRLTDAEAASVLERGGRVEDPNAGAGSYKRLCPRVGLTFVEVLDWTSSAGDWQFFVTDKDGMFRILFQDNRHPYHGFSYAMSAEEFCSIEDAREFAAA